MHVLNVVVKQGSTTFIFKLLCIYLENAPSTIFTVTLKVYKPASVVAEG